MGHCRFGINCSYSHSSPNPTPSDTFTRELSVLRGEVDDLKSLVASLSNSLSMALLHSTPDETSINTINTKPFQCEQCDYAATSSTVLKRHNSMKHKPEVLRESPCNDISQYIHSPAEEERNEHFTISPSSVQSPDLSLADSFIIPDPDPNEGYVCITKDCGYTSFDFHELIEHTNLFNHNDPCPHCGVSIPNIDELYNHHFEHCLPCPGPPHCFDPDCIV